MKKTVFLGALTVAGLAAGLASAGTLDDVKARGKLNCGVTTGLVGFASPDANGEWQGFDVGCMSRGCCGCFGRRQWLLNSFQQPAKHASPLWRLAKSIMLARNTTWTLSRDVDLKFDLRWCELL